MNKKSSLKNDTKKDNENINTQQNNNKNNSLTQSNKNNKKKITNFSANVKLTKSIYKYKKAKGLTLNNKKNNSYTINIDNNQKRDSILYDKFIEFKNNIQMEKNPTKKAKLYKPPLLIKQSKTFVSLSLSKLNHNKSKLDTSIDLRRSKNKMKEFRKKNKLKINKYYIKKRSVKIINKNELFNKIINKNYDNNENNANINNLEKNNNIIEDTKLKSFRRNNSCQTFNNVKLKEDFEMNDIQNNNEEEKEIKKEKNKNNNMTLNLISQKYYEKMKFVKYKYYNVKNTEYANERRQRVEDKINEIMYEKYKIIRPLRMTERVFYIKDESKKDKNITINNKTNFDNHMCKMLNSKALNNYNYNRYYYMDNFKDNTNIGNKNNDNCNQLIYYKNQIDYITKMRKYLSIEDFFYNFRRDYNLLDFNFTFLYQHFKK